jgi:hypothetical protein
MPVESPITRKGSKAGSGPPLSPGGVYDGGILYAGLVFGYSIVWFRL